jgi:hypothetical protein
MLAALHGCAALARLVNENDEADASVAWMFGVCPLGRGAGVRMLFLQIVLCKMRAGLLLRPPLDAQIRVAVEIVRDTRLAAHPAESKLQHRCPTP